MEQRKKDIQWMLSEIPEVTVIEDFELQPDLNLKGKIQLRSDEFEDVFEFEVCILPEYPLKRHDTEGIRFINKKYLQLDHVMENGSICIHTSHHPNLRRKLQIDILSLKNWIRKFFYQSNEEKRYEHIIVKVEPFQKSYYSFLFTELDHTFRQGHFGFFEFAEINNGLYDKQTMHNYVVLNFKTPYGTPLTDCLWSQQVKTRLDIKGQGFFIFLGEAPAAMGKFAFSNWRNLENFIEPRVVKFLCDWQKDSLKYKGMPIPLMLGYHIPNKEVHWQAVMLEIGKFPLESRRVKGVLQGIFKDRQISWAITRNCSYKYFFGRGSFTPHFTQKKMLIIGVGAIGSIMATTLARCGCTHIDLVDFDIKEPENVCRSSYSFLTGITKKVVELGNELITISPFVNVAIMDDDFFQVYTKILRDYNSSKLELENVLNEYDLILDCSTDNDLLYIFEGLKTPDLYSFSVTNHAKELVCVVEPRSCHWTLHQFENVLNQDLDDVYNPTGCWSPTFKASYNDIDVLVQYALKHINYKIGQQKPLRNFVVKTDMTNGLNITHEEF